MAATVDGMVNTIDASPATDVVEAVVPEAPAHEMGSPSPVMKKEEAVSEVMTAPAASQKPVIVFGKPVTGVAGNTLRWARNFGARWRKGAIEKSPRLVVNYSSNIMGMIQLVAELFMFSSSGTDLVNKENRGKPLHYLIDPPKNILDAVFKKGGLGSHPLQKEFYTKMPERLAALPGKIAKLPEKLTKIPGRIVKLPESFANGVRRVGDTGAATLRDRVNAAGEVQKLTNKWSARATFSGLVAWSLVAVIPDKKDTPEETEKNTILAKNNPIGYVAKRVYQGVNPLQWWNHKRQLGGLGALCSGTFSFISGFRQVAGKELGHQIYMRNFWQTLGGAITATSGAVLLLAIDNDSGYRNFGTLQLLRTFTLPNAIYTRFKGINKEKAVGVGKALGIQMDVPGNFKESAKGASKIQEQGAAQYLIGSAFLNFKNFFAASLAGAEKREDGTVVDHQAMRELAKAKAKEVKQHKNKDAKPEMAHELGQMAVTKDGKLEAVKAEGAPQEKLSDVVVTKESMTQVRGHVAHDQPVHPQPEQRKEHTPEHKLSGPMPQISAREVAHTKPEHQHVVAAIPA